MDNGSFEGEGGDGGLMEGVTEMSQTFKIKSRPSHHEILSSKHFC